MKARCDRCGAEAFYHAVKGKQALDFCIHHGRLAEDSLVLSGWTLKNESARINVKPSPSGHV